MTMPDSNSSKETRFKAIRSEVHPFCMVCGQSNPFGLGVKFDSETDGSVTATFLGHPALEGFEGLLHGGMVASLLEGAMTNCLFAHGCVGMAGELNVRYQEPVVIGEELSVRAWIERSAPPLYWLTAELKQGNRIKATATAKFMERI